MVFDKEGKDLVCPRCGSEARLIEAEEIYGRKGYGLIWVCKNYPYCDCYVGCHKGTTTPKGNLANYETRKWRIKVHSILDPLWREGKYERGQLYHDIGIMANKIPFHVGELTIEECKKVIPLIGRLVG